MTQMIATTGRELMARAGRDLGSFLFFAGMVATTFLV